MVKGPAAVQAAMIMTDDGMAGTHANTVETRPGPNPQKPLTAGVFLGQLEERYQSIIWPGIVDAAEELDLNLVFFPGAPLEVPHDIYVYMAERNAIYDLANTGNLDGLILFSGTLAGYVDENTLERFYARFRSLPVVSLSLPLEGASNILVDNSIGMRNLVSHLIEVHGHQRIAFIRGPEGHAEADERYQAYLDTLAAHKIAFDEDLVVTAQFTATTSRKAITGLLDRVAGYPDVIVSANDRMAVGIIDVLQERGLDIPGDIAVTGFDDIEESRYTLSPLTTVAQPLYEQGRKAVEMLHSQLTGKTKPETITLPARLVVRQSCGCSLAQEIIKHEPDAHPAHPAGPADSGNQRERIITEVYRAWKDNQQNQQGAADIQWVERLYDAFLDAFNSGDPGRFLNVLEELLIKTLQKDGQITGWQEMIYTLGQRVNPYLNAKSRLLCINETWQRAQAMVGEVAARTQANNRYQAILRTLQISDTGQALLTTFDIDKLMNTVYESLPELGITSCFVALYDNQGKVGEQARMVLAFDDRQRFDLGPGGLQFPACRFVPEALQLPDRRRSWVLLPLYFQTDHLGFIIMEIGPRDGMVYETIRQYISSALNGALLLQERIRAEEELKKYRDFLEERVRERTNELNEINIQLQYEVSERKLAEANLIEAYDTTLEGWARALELRDKETENHSRRVTELTLILAKTMGLPAEELVQIRRGAILHDIGKMAIPDRILRKAGELTKEEFEIIKQHPKHSYDLLSRIPFLEKALEIPYCHHENWDGSGYPRGLVGEQIPLAARIFSIVDVWDAVQSERPYNRAWSRERTINFLLEQSEKKFDPRCVETFMRLIKDGKI
ncbi:MAG: substrate-binding domain-containing protein [Anaerolineales bacterium]|nr:substrate-binding domain-containing protein [Anaerolineales bacterium]